MKIADLYARRGLTLSVEFFAPKTDKGDENLFGEIEIIKQVNPGFYSFTYGAGCFDLVGYPRSPAVSYAD